MPKLNDENLEIMNIKGTNFQYSAVKLDQLGATEYTLVTLVVDVSSSVYPFKDDLEKCIKEIVTACRRSPRADNLMIRFLTFNSSGNEEHGYKPLTDCNPEDYIGSLTVGGMTALYDASYDAIVATGNYGKVLIENDFDANGIVFILTDGCDNQSAQTPKSVNNALRAVIKMEELESLVSVLVGVDIDPDTDQYLKDYNSEAGFTQYVEIGKATEKTLAKLAEFVSKSISSQSNSLGTGSASNQASLTI